MGKILYTTRGGESPEITRNNSRTSILILFYEYSTRTVYTVVLVHFFVYLCILYTNTVVYVVRVTRRSARNVPG